MYSSETSVLADSYNSFLNRIKFASLSEEQRADLNKPITKEEVLEAIKSLKGSGPGPEFYKKNCKFILEPLADMYIDSFKKGCLPATLNMAYILLIQKKKKHRMNAVLRPISLLNVDCKLLSKLLARRLESLC